GLPTEFFRSMAKKSSTTIDMTLRWGACSLLSSISPVSTLRAMICTSGLTEMKSSKTSCSAGEQTGLSFGFGHSGTERQEPGEMGGRFQRTVFMTLGDLAHLLPLACCLLSMF